MNRILAVCAFVLLATACTEIIPEGSFEPAPDTSGSDISGSSGQPTTDPPADARVSEDTRVLDGDTFEVTLDGQPTEVRLLGINTPERDECFGSEARDYARNIVLNAGTNGAAISVVGDEFDQFGRLLGYVYAGGESINLQLVETGHALALSNDHDLVEPFKLAETRAADASVGLWNDQACPPASPDELEIADLIGDAPGPDDENPNGEYVVIRNSGDTEADLDGWTIRDESSRHRFTFDQITLAPGGSVTVFSGCGEASHDEFYWCASDPVWSNAGDTGYLLDPSGNYRSLFAFSR